MSAQTETIEIREYLNEQFVETSACYWTQCLCWWNNKKDFDSTS